MDLKIISNFFFGGGDFSIFSKNCHFFAILLKKLQLCEFSCYRYDSHIKMKLKAEGTIAQPRFFEIWSCFFVTRLQIGQKWNFGFWHFYTKIADCKSILQENCTKNEKSRPERLFLIRSSIFWYMNHLCSVKIDWVEAISINLHTKKKK